MDNARLQFCKKYFVQYNDKFINLLLLQILKLEIF